MCKKVFVLLCCGILGIFVYARWIEPERLHTTSFTVETKWEINPCKIVFFTDTHFGKYYDMAHIEKIVKKINETEADIVIFGGDLLDNYARDREELDLTYLQEALQNIEAKTGKYAIWGNHDYGGGAVRVYEDIMTGGGFEVLDDESRILEEYHILLVGYDDYLMGWTDPSLYTLKSDGFHIIAAHEPVIAPLIESETEDFVLSGHTHGGQVTIPFLTKKLLPQGSGEFVKGRYTAEEIGGSPTVEMYTSSGIGMTRYPFRFGNVPEIVEVYLRQAE